VSTGAKGDESSTGRVWVAGCYGPFTFFAGFEVYETFICLILQFFSGRGETQIHETGDTASLSTGGR
jgi:hypothetical protein